MLLLKKFKGIRLLKEFLHADLQRVNPDTKISISVPVRFLNEDNCMGVKMHGGAISRLINNIDISCLASNLPEYLEVDVAELDVGDSIFLSALNLPEGVEIPSLALGDDRDQAVVSVTEAKVLDVEPEIIETEEDGESSGEEDAAESTEGQEEADE